VRHPNQLWDLAILFGGLSVVAHTIARHSWTAFEAALRDALTRDTGDIPSLRAWDFSFWHWIGHAAAGLSILCSVLWLISR
jgi:hypothetical protein